MNRYPDMAVTALTAALAERLDVPAERVATGPGSVGRARQLIAGDLRPGRRGGLRVAVVRGVPDPRHSSAGAAPVQVPLPGERHDLDAMAAAITERTRLVFVCTPNNPTGTTVGRTELEVFLDRVPADVLVVIDEAYREFVRDPEVARRA